MKMTCQCWKKASVENDQVLAFFVKYYNKWYLAKDFKYLWEKNDKPDNILVLARLMKKSGSTYGPLG